MVEVVVAPDEVPILLAHKRDSPHVLVRFKAEAVLLASHGVSPEVIGQVTGRSGRTVAGWLRQWNRTRLASVVTGHAGNANAAKLTAAQKAEVARILAAPPSEVGLNAAFWDVPTLRHLVRARFEVVYESDSSYHLLLTYSGLSFKKPDTFDRRRDETKIAARMAQIRAEIAPLLADPQWVVLACDEVRVQYEAETRRAWLPAGRRTVVKVDRRRVAQSWFGALNQATGRCTLHRMDWQDGPNVLDALTRLVATHRGKKLAIVWDNARFHRANLVRDALGEHHQLANVRLIWMPPYAPDENPVEHVWNTAKGHLANLQRDTPEDTFNAFENYVATNHFPYRFSQMPEPDNLD